MSEQPFPSFFCSTDPLTGLCPCCSQLRWVTLALNAHRAEHPSGHVPLLGIQLLATRSFLLTPERLPEEETGPPSSRKEASPAKASVINEVCPWHLQALGCHEDLGECGARSKLGPGCSMGCPVPWARRAGQHALSRGFPGWATCWHKRWFPSERMCSPWLRTPLFKGSWTRTTLFYFYFFSLGFWVAVSRLFILTPPPSEFLLPPEYFSQAGLCHGPALSPRRWFPALLPLSSRHSRLPAAPEPGSWAGAAAAWEEDKKFRVEAASGTRGRGCPHPCHLQRVLKILGS